MKREQTFWPSRPSRKELRCRRRIVHARWANGLAVQVIGQEKVVFKRQSRNSIAIKCSNPDTILHDSAAVSVWFANNVDAMAEAMRALLMLRAEVSYRLVWLALVAQTSVGAP